MSAPQETAIAKVSKLFLEKRVVDAFMNSLGNNSKTVNKYTQSVLNTLVSKPELLECTPKSIVLASLTAAAIGLPVDVRQQAYIVAYKNKQGIKEAQLQIGYRGYIQLGIESGQLLDATARAVYANEKFKVYCGSNERIEHEPVIIGERGEFVGVYAIAKLVGGIEKFVVLSKVDIERLRLKNRFQSKEPSGAWSSDYASMAQAKAIKQICKTIAMGQATAAAEMEDAIEEGRQPAINVPFTVLDEPESSKAAWEGTGKEMADSRTALEAAKKILGDEEKILGDDDFMPDFDQPAKYEPPPASKKEEDPRRLKLIVQFGKAITSRDVDSLFVGNQLEKMFGTSELDKMPVDTLEMAIAWAKGLPAKQ